MFLLGFFFVSSKGLMMKVRRLVCDSRPPLACWRGWQVQEASPLRFAQWLCAKGCLAGRLAQGMSGSKKMPILP